MRYVTSWKYSLGDLKTHKKGFATLRAARRKYDEHVTERNALVMIDGMNEVDSGRLMTYVKGVDDYKGALSRLAAEILQELVTCRDVALPRHLAGDGGRRRSTGTTGEGPSRRRGACQGRAGTAE